MTEEFLSTRQEAVKPIFTKIIGFKLITEENKHYTCDASIVVWHVSIFLNSI